MKTTFINFLLIFFCICGNCFAQDTIYSRTNEKTEVKVLEINETIIRYKKSANLSGPDYVLNKKELHKIVYANGTVERFDTLQPVSKANHFSTIDTMKNDNTAHLVSGVDTLFMKNFTRITGRVVEIGPDEVKIKNVKKPEGPATVFKKTRINKIAYADGRVEYMGSMREAILTDSMYLLGVRHAEKYYKHPGGQGGVLILSFFTGGIIGIVPAIICSSTTPKIYNLGCPDKKLMENNNYMTGYKWRAKKIKQKRIWTGYAIGVAGAVIVGIIINSTP